jgi:hypothetical protein
MTKTEEEWWEKFISGTEHGIYGRQTLACEALKLRNTEEINTAQVNKIKVKQWKDIYQIFDKIVKSVTGPLLIHLQCHEIEADLQKTKKKRSGDTPRQDGSTLDMIKLGKLFQYSDFYTH